MTNYMRGTSKQQYNDRIERATMLAEVLEDCVNLYMEEIADDEPRETRQLARQMLARKLYQPEAM